MKLIPGLVICLCFLPIVCIADDQYKNSMYGIDAKIDGDWKIVSSATLEVCIYALSDQQLNELLRDRREILHLRYGDKESKTSVRVDFLRLTPSELQTPLEHAQSWERGAISRKEIVERRPEACKLGGTPAASIAVRSSANGVSFTSYVYFVRRATSIMQITGIVHHPTDQATIDELTRMIMNITITHEADEPNR